MRGTDGLEAGCLRCKLAAGLRRRSTPRVLVASLPLNGFPLKLALQTAAQSDGEQWDEFWRWRKDGCPRGLENDAINIKNNIFIFIQYPNQNDRPRGIPQGLLRTLNLKTN